MEDGIMDIEELLKNKKFSTKDIRSIMEKKRQDLDGMYKISDLSPLPEDLREVRDVAIMSYCLGYWPQIYPIIVNIVDGVIYIIDGITRVEGAKLNGWKEISCMVFENLTEFECDCLNTATNSPQKGFNKDEIRKFFVKYREKFLAANNSHIRALAHAFGYRDIKALKEVFALIDVSEQEPETMTHFKQQNPGRDRGEFDYRRVKIAHTIIDHKEAFREVAAYSEEFHGRDVERQLKAVVKKTDELIHRGYSDDDAVNLVKSRGKNVEHINRLGIVPDAKKFEAFEQKIITYKDIDDLYIFNPTILDMRENGDDDPADNEAIRALKASEVQGFKVTIIDREEAEANLWKKSEYGSHPNLTIVCKSAEEFLFEDLESSDKETLIHFNFGGGVKGGSLFFISPKILESLKKIRKNLVVSLMCVESFKSNLLEMMMFFGIERDKERIETYDQFFSRLGYKYKIVWKKMEHYGYKALVIIDLGG
jgi:hypothetical protein